MKKNIPFRLLSSSKLRASKGSQGLTRTKSSRSFTSSCCGKSQDVLPFEAPEATNKEMDEVLQYSVVEKQEHKGGEQIETI